MVSERASQPAFFGVSALLFAASAAATILWCGSMSAMGGMPMPSGWTMSMVWMRMPGQTWPGAAASFLGMWVVMMAAMMLPSLVPMLWRYRRAVGGTGRMAWQRDSGYNQRARIEGQFARWKQVIGDGLRFHSDGAGITEVGIAAVVLNRMLDRPNSVRVA